MIGVAVYLKQNRQGSDASNQTKDGEVRRFVDKNKNMINCLE